MIAPWGKRLRAGGGWRVVSGRVVVLVLTPCISEGRGGVRKKAVLQPGEHRRDVIQVRALF